MPSFSRSSNAVHFKHLAKIIGAAALRLSGNNELHISGTFYSIKITNMKFSHF